MLLLQRFFLVKCSISAQYFDNTFWIKIGKNVKISKKNVTSENCGKIKTHNTFWDVGYDYNPGYRS